MRHDALPSEHPRLHTEAKRPPRRRRASAPRVDPNAPTPSQFLSRLPKPDADAGAEAPTTTPSAGIPDRSYMAIANQDRRFGGIGETMYSEYAIYEAAGESRSCRARSSRRARQSPT